MSKKMPYIHETKNIPSIALYFENKEYTPVEGECFKGKYLIFKTLHSKSDFFLVYNDRIDCVYRYSGSPKNQINTQLSYKNYYASEEILIKINDKWCWNGDTGMVPMEHKLHPYNFTTISPTTIKRLIKINGDIKTLNIIDETSDSYMEITASDRNYIKEMHKKGLSPIFHRTNREYNLGYTDSGSRIWHKPSTVLIRHNKKDYLFARDERSYFGVELPKQVKNIKEAYESLKPKEVIEAEKKGIRNISRQGEWFLVPIEYKTTDYFKGFHGDKYSDTNIIFPKDTNNSNDHLFWGEFVMDKKYGMVLIKGELTHSDHQEIKVKSPHIVYKNTAVRSVSVEGVD